MQNKLLHTKKFTFLIIAVILLATAVKVGASDDHASNQQIHPQNQTVLGLGEKAEVKNNGAEKRNSQDNLADDNKSSESDVNCDSKVSNHGAVVSCVAKEHLGGEEVSDIAKSIDDKGQNKDDVVALGITTSPTPTITSTPASTPTPTPTVSPTNGITVTPSPTETLENNTSLNTKVSGVTVKKEMDLIMKTLQGWLRTITLGIHL